jgi:hypothetical protein
VPSNKSGENNSNFSSKKSRLNIKIVNMILTIVNPDMQSIKSDLNNKFNIIEITTLKQMHSIKMPNE